MQQELLIAILTGLIAMFGWGFAEFSTKKSVDKVGTISSLVWAHVFGSIIIFFFILLDFFIFNHKIILPANLFEWLGLAFFGILQTLVYYFAYKGFEKGQVALLSPIFASFAGLVALVSVVFLGEVLKVNLIFALIFIFIGILLLNLDINGLKAKQIRIIGAPGVKEVGIATIFATFWTLGWDKFTGGKEWAIYAFFMFIFMTLSALGLSKIKKVDLSKVQPGIWKYLWFIGLGEAGAYLAISLGYASTSFTSVIAILSGASSLPTIILARIFLKEKLALIQLIGSLIVIIGIFFLSLG